MTAADNFLIPNATVLVEIAVFAAVLGAVARFVLPHLRAAMDRRQEEIRSSMEASRRAQQLLADAEAEYQAKLDQARRQASAIVASSRRVAAHLQQEAGRRATEEHDRIVGRAQSDIDRATARAGELQHGAAGSRHEATQLRHGAPDPGEILPWRG